MPLILQHIVKEVNMSLPTRTIIEDLEVICGYLSTKPTGATHAEAKAVVNKKHLDGRKLAALRFWGLIEEEGDRMKVSDRGREAVRDSGAARSNVLKGVIEKIAPYKAVIERAVHRGDDSISATEVAAHWHEHFTSEVSEKDKGLNDQAVCFFHVAQGADLGVLTIGRKGMPTRFDFAVEEIRSFAGLPSKTVVEDKREDAPEESSSTESVHVKEGSRALRGAIDTNRVFITHGRNLKILDQVKELVQYGKFEPVVAMEHETSAKPVPEKVMDDMRSCEAAVIHVGADRVLFDSDLKEFRLINENVLIEIGAAMALYGNRFALLVEEGIDLPSNLQGLYECRYSGEELNMPAAMKLLKTMSEF